MCSKSLAKCLLVVFNSVFFLLGAAVLAAGIFILLDKDYIIDTLSRVHEKGETVAESLDKVSIIEGAAYALIAAGAFVFIIGFSGCCGALKESKCLLIVYAVLVGLIFALELAAGVAVYFYRDLVNDQLKDFLYDVVRDEYQGVRYDSNGDLSESTDAVSAALDFAQAYFECCGVDNYTDYASTTAWNSTYSVPIGGSTYSVVAVVPITCCVMADHSKFPSKLDQVTFTNITECLQYASPSVTHHTGCYEAVKDELMKYATILMGVGIGIAVLELLGIVSACFLLCKIGKDDD